jgi:predicted ABC-type ATPase
LCNLKEAIQKTNRAYLFDNSGTVAKLIAEISNGTDVSLIDQDFVPKWFLDHVVKKVK